ncbi:MAG: FHA domain-containing protein [Armatimonadota bacterium]
METAPDYYALLGVAPDAPDAVIRAAFRTLVPDAQQDQPRFARLKEAFDTLKDPDRRAAYDRERAAQAAAERTVLPTASAGVLRPLPKDDGRTTAFAAVPCSACGTPAPAGEIWCPECGLRCGTVAGSAPGAAPALLLDGGSRWPLAAGPTTVGRESSDIVLPDASVSRRHARFEVDALGTVRLEDLGSTNGTRAGGKRLAGGERMVLADGMAVRFGSVAGKISIPGAPEPTAPRIEARDTRAPAPAALPAGGWVAPRLVRDTGEVFPIPAGGAVVGRRAGADIVLGGDAFLSGRHARIVREGDGWAIEDLGSTNGTSVAGTRLSSGARVALTDGVTMTLGRTQLTFRIS